MQGLSYADFYTLGGVVALEAMGGPLIPWRAGEGWCGGRLGGIGYGRWIEGCGVQAEWIRWIIRKLRQMVGCLPQIVDLQS